VQDSARGPLRVVVVDADAVTRDRTMDALRNAADVEVVAWAESVAQLLTLGTLADVCLTSATPSAAQAARLRERGCAVVELSRGGDPVAALPTTSGPVRVPSAQRPDLAVRQREVLVAYVTGSHVLPTVARQLGMGAETVKTHLRRIRAKYAAVGRPAPTRHDLYVRAVEDGLVPPPSERS
jgi:DNA-binding CsgD family transcriptional regulator